MSLPEFDWHQYGVVGGIVIGGAWVMRQVMWLIVQGWRPGNIRDQLQAMREEQAQAHKEGREERRQLHQGQNDFNRRLSYLEGQLKSLLEGKK